jgi:hypothetical protein
MSPYGFEMCSFKLKDLACLSDAFTKREFRMIKYDYFSSENASA